MRIEFDPTNPDEAAAVRAMLTAMLTAMQPQPTAGDLGIVMHEAPTNDAWHNGTTYTPPQAGSTIKVDDESSFVVPEPQTDSTGTPWDARIHSTPPTTNKDGTWRAKRGVKAEEIAAVRAERTAPVGRIDDMTEDEMSEDRSEENPNAGVTAQEQSAPPAPNAPVGEQSAPPAPPAPSFLDVMKAITAAQKDGKIDTAKVKELCAAVGAGESTMGLNGPDNGDKRGAFMALLGEVVS